MAIEITKAQHAPQLVYNRILLSDLHMTQRLNDVDEYPPYYSLNMIIRRYAVDNEGKRHYHPKTERLSIDDYTAVAMTKAQSGDYDLANAAGAIEAALAKILQDQRPEYGSAKVV